MAGQEVSLSLAHRCMRHASAEFMGLHKCKADTTPQAKLTPEDRVKLFMDNSFARYCAFNHLQNGDIVQVSVPSVWREAVTIIGGDEDEPIFVEGIEVINSPKPSGKTYFVAQSSRWVTADVAKKAKRLVFAQTYLVRFSTQNGYKADEMTDVSGEFAFNETIAGFGIDEVRVFFRDVDGSDGGGEFAPDSLKVSVHKVAEGDGNWHRGTFESDDVEIYLKKK